MTTHEAEHEITVAAPAADVYRLLSGVEDLPRIFPPTVFVEQMERKGDEEQIRVWATVNGEAMSWTSRRVFDERALRIDFWQEAAAAPVDSLRGAYVVEPLGEDRSRIRLLHTCRALDDDAEALEWIARAVDQNSRLQLASLKDSLEQAHAGRDLTFSFEDTVRVAGSVEDVYDFVNDAHLWGDRLPHILTVRFVEDPVGLQTLETAVRVEDGSVHTTKAYRVCFPHRKIAYKAARPPALLSLHIGSWTFEEDADGVLASARHTVTLDPAGITGYLGPQATAGDAEEYVRNALRANSRATLACAKEYAEARR